MSHTTGVTAGRLWQTSAEVVEGTTGMLVPRCVSTNRNAPYQGRVSQGPNPKQAEEERDDWFPPIVPFHTSSQGMPL